MISINNIYLQKHKNPEEAYDKIKKNGFQPRVDNKPWPIPSIIDFETDPFLDSNWRFQLNALRMTETSILMYGKTNKIKYLMEVFDFVVKWIEYDELHDVVHFRWHDMGTGLRAMKLAYVFENIGLLSFGVSSKEYQCLLKSVDKHADKLLEPNYLSKGNHGMFQMHGLMALSLVMPPSELQKKARDYAKKNMEMLIKKQFDSEGMHTENSPDYHFFIKGVTNSFLSTGWYESEYINKLQKKIQSNTSWLLYPNSEVVRVGDTHQMKRSADEDELTMKQLNSSKRLFCPSLNGGYLQQEFKESGYFIIRSPFFMKVEESSMLFLLSAFKNTGHRQSDDFSFELFEYGNTILVDAGKYAYQKNSYRSYVQSTRAHNSVEIDGKDYSRSGKYFYDSAIKKSSQIDNNFIVRIKHQRKDIECTHERIIIYRPRCYVFVIDLLTSEVVRKYTQWFHLNEKFKLCDKQGESQLCFPSDEVKVFSQHMAINDKSNQVDVIKGQSEPRLQGFRSTKYNEIVENFAIGNTLNSKSAQLVTSFSFNEPIERLKLEIATDGNCDMSFMYAGETVLLQSMIGDNVCNDGGNFVFKEDLWFFNNHSFLENIFFSANTLTLDLKKPPAKHTFYLLLGDEKSNSLRTNDLFKIDNLGDSINVSVTLKGEDKAKVSVFLQEFQLNEKVKSKSYPLVLGGNNIVFNKHPSSTALKLLFRFSHDDTGQITLSNLTVKPKNIEEIIPPKSDDEVFIHNEIPIEYDKVQPHIVKVGSLDTNILTCFKSNSKKLVVFFNGAVNIDKTPLPVYQRHSWLEKLPYSSMIIMDPTIYDFLNETESSYITWYQGDKDSFFLENLNPIIEGVTKELGVKYENVAFYGSSAGGFAALMSASMLKGSKACVVNPQVDALKYHKKYSQKILSHLGINTDGPPPSKMRLNVIDYFEKKSSFPFVYYKQNKQDVLHYQQHFMLLNDSYINNHQHDKMISDITDDEQGHMTIPLYDEAFIDIEKTFSLGNDTNVNHYNENLPLRIFGFNSNKSTVFSFKPRTDVASYNLSYPLDWNLDPFNDRNWCFQLNSWRHLDLTLLSLDKQFDEVIFNRVIDVIFDWERHSITEQNLNDYTWYDMATGLRALKLAFIINRFSHVNSSFKISNDRKSRILEIARHHLSELNRQPLSINNHGIFQAHGLVVLSLCLGNEVSIQHGIMKMEELIEQQFNSDGYHVENSDKYHWFVLDTFDKFLNLDVYRASTKIRENLNLSRLVKFWTTFPNKESLMIGDSEYKVRDLDFSSANHQCDPDSYIVKNFEDSGYLFVRSCFDSDPTSASMLFFQTAYKNNTHRHADDFNVLLYEFGMNILVDAGQYAYSKDKERGYILSTKAHNSLVIDDKSYQLKDKMYYESALKFCDEIDNTFIFKTELHRTKPQVNHSRIIFYKPSDFLIVIDKVDSNTLRKFEQVWHFHQDLDVTRFNNVFAADINEDIRMNIYPSVISLDSNFLHTKNVVNNLSIVKGQVDPELQGWRSLKYRELTPNYALTNSINSKKALLITKFIFTDSNDNPSDLQVTYDINGGNIILTVLSKSLNVDIKLSI
jgi:hypothetical protein